VSWQASFVAMSAALGEEVGTAMKALSGARAIDPAARELLGKLESKSKAQRAQALAMALGVIAKDVERLDLVEAAT
jgi:hypothetical protein